MLCTAISVEEVIEWVGCLMASSSISSNSATRLYAELCHFDDIDALFEDIIERKRMLESLPEKVSMLKKKSIESNKYENLSHEEQSVLKNFYAKVLSHHGFRDVFIQEFYRRLIPISTRAPSAISIDRQFVLKGPYVDTPFKLLELG